MGSGILLLQGLLGGLVRYCLGRLDVAPHNRLSEGVVQGRFSFGSCAIFLKYEFFIKHQTEGLAPKYKSNQKPRTKIFD